MRRILEVCLLVSVTSLASHAAPASPVALSFEAPWECPNRDYFWQQFWSRSITLAHAKDCQPSEACSAAGNQGAMGNFSEAEFPEAHATPQVAVEVRIRHFGTSYSGLVQLRDAAGGVIERRVSGQICVDVTTALALATAIALDTILGPAQHEGSVPERQDKPSYAYSLGVAFGIHSAAEPMVVPVFGLAASVRALRVWAAPELRLEALVSVSGRAHDASNLAEARFVWLASRTSVCAFRASVASLEFGPCAVLELGALRGVGLTGTNRQSQTGLWLAPGALFYGALRHGNVRFGVQSGLVVPVVRDRFLFAPNTEVFHPPALGLLAEIGLAWTYDG